MLDQNQNQNQNVGIALGVEIFGILSRSWIVGGCCGLPKSTVMHLPGEHPSVAPAPSTGAFRPTALTLEFQHTADVNFLFRETSVNFVTLHFSRMAL